MKKLKPAEKGFENKSSLVAGFFKRILVCFKYFTVHFPLLAVRVMAFPHFLDLYLSDQNELQNNLVKKKLKEENKKSCFTTSYEDDKGIY